MSDINPDNTGTRQAARHGMQALPSNMLAKEFGKVYVRDDGPLRHVEFTVWVQELSGNQAEGWRTGLALDASASMRDWYGRTLQYTDQGIPQALLNEYAQKGWADYRVEDGEKVLAFKPEAHEDALSKGFVRFTDNIVQPFARDVIAYLGKELDTEGKPSVIYWACGSGDAFEVVGEFSANECQNLELQGPNTVDFGQGTHLLPALTYFCTTYESARNSMFVFLTDGRLDDLEDVKRFTKDLAKRIAQGRRNPVKCVLIGVGNHIDESQMIELDDLPTGTDVDIWDHKIAKEMRAISEIIVELISDIVTSQPATIYDDQGSIVKKFSDGLPASVSFSMPATSKFFELEIGSQRFPQKVVSNS